MRNFFSSSGRSQGGHVMLSPFFQPCYSTVLNEKSNNLLPIFSRCAAVNHYSATVPQKHEFRKFQLHCIEFNVPRTNFSIRQLRGKNALLQSHTSSTPSYSVFATTKPGVVCPRHLQEGDRRENACPPVAYISDLIRVSLHVFQLAEKWSPEKNNNLESRAHTKHR